MKQNTKEWLPNQCLLIKFLQLYNISWLSLGIGTPEILFARFSFELMSY